MSRVKILKAILEDNEGLLEFLKENPSPGLIQIQLDRTPSYFDSIRVEGFPSDVMIGKETNTGKIAGVGNRSEKNCFVNGKPEQLGYLSTLRIKEEYRNSIFLVKSYNFLKELHKKSKVKFYLTTILKENKLARAILTSKRAGLPIYESIGFYHTYIISKNQKINTANNNYSVQVAKEEEITDIILFLNSYGKEKQFFPIYTKEDFLNKNTLLNGIQISDILIAREKGEIVGVISLWKQNSFRKWIVKDYEPILKYSRRIYNIYAYLMRKPVLPALNTEFKYRFLSTVCIKENKPEIFKALLNVVWSILDQKTDTDYLVAGFHEKNTIGDVVNQFPHWKITSEVFVVYWEEEKQDIPDFRNGIPYLEVGSL